MSNDIPSLASFSGADTTIIAGYRILGKFVEIGNIQTLTYSVHRDTDHARSLGFDTPRGFVKGQTVIAGTVIFTVLNQHVLTEVFNLIPEMENKYYRIDQLPPMDILVFQQNDYGNYDEIGIYGVEFVNEGQVMSVHDIITENTTNYFARNVAYINKGSGTSIGTSDAMTKAILQKGNVYIENMQKRFL